MPGQVPFTNTEKHRGLVEANGELLLYSVINPAGEKRDRLVHEAMHQTPGSCWPMDERHFDQLFTLTLAEMLEHAARKLRESAFYALAKDTEHAAEMRRPKESLL